MAAAERTRGWLPAALGVLLAVAPAPGAESARALLDRVHQLNLTTRRWTDRRQRMAVTIVDRRGSEHHREMEVLTKRYEGDASRSLLFFHSPPSVQGLGFLQWLEPHEPDRRWLYLPALKRVRQITGTAQTESFAGTDFSYEDLALMYEVLDWTEQDARSDRTGGETVDGAICDVIELAPNRDDVTYGKIRLWLGRDDQVVHKYTFEDRKGRLVKVLIQSDFRTVDGFPAAHRLEMRNEQSGSRTIVVLSEVRYNQGLTDDTFTQRRLERGG